MADAYQEYVERRRATAVAEIEVKPVLTERETTLLIELVQLAGPKLATDEQYRVMESAASKLGVGLRRAREN